MSSRRSWVLVEKIERWATRDARRVRKLGTSEAVVLVALDRYRRSDRKGERIPRAYRRFHGVKNH